MEAGLHGSPLEILTRFSFIGACLAMGVASFFFFQEKDRVPQRFRLPLLLATIITGVACVMYYYMMDKYIPGKAFPTELRYLDWIITTPLMLIEFAVLLEFKDRAGVIWRLFLWDIVMILFGFLGETMGFETGGFQARWVMFVVGCGGWLGILVYLYTGIRKEANLADVQTRKAIILLTKFVTLGWLIYPVGYIIRAVRPDLSDLCQLVYNLGDLVNKVGMGVIVYAAAVATSRATSPSNAAVAEPTAASTASGQVGSGMGEATA